MAKVLIREEPRKSPEEYPWNDGKQTPFHFDSADIEKLETGGIVWRGETAFSLEELTEV